jgi:hypothetical protein
LFANKSWSAVEGEGSEFASICNFLLGLSLMIALSWPLNASCSAIQQCFATPGWSEEFLSEEVAIFLSEIKGLKA